MAVQRSERRRAARDDDPERRGRRSEPRAYVFLPASAEAISGHRPVQLLDVSRAGAKLQGAELPDPGKDVILRCGDVDTFATIAWAEGEQRGVTFDEPLSVAELMNLRDLGFAVAQANLTPDDIVAASDWLNGIAR